MTQYDGRYVDEIGLIKFDFLGLKTLTMLDSIVRRVKEGRGVDVDLARLALDDKATYRLIAKGDTVGVFQMESGGMRKLLTQLRPTTFEEIVAVNALYRPGPLDSGMVDEFIKRKHGKVEVKYPHPAITPILQETYGVVVYQEQVMQIAQVLAGYTLGDADMLRRAMGKKDPQKMKKERDRFLAGAVRKGVREDQAGAIFDQMETFAAYGFNKSHSAAYSLVSYQTAYLKTHYPEEFMAGLMTLEMDDTDKTYKNMAECREHGIRILPPDVNQSLADFTVVPEPAKESKRAIRFGLAAVKGIGGRAVDAIVEARREGPFKSLAEFCERVQAQVVNKRVVESLIACGAFDFTGQPRQRLSEAADRTIQWAQANSRDASSGQIGLFGGATSAVANPEPPLSNVAEWPAKELLKAERDAIGFFITAHPLDKYARDLKRFTDATTAKLSTAQSGAKVRLGGVVHGLKLKNSKKGDRYATFLLEDLEGAIEVIAWPETFRKYEAAIQGDEPVFVRGTAEVSEERCQLIADEIGSLASARESGVRQVHIAVVHDRVDEAKLESLRETLRQHQGTCPTFLHVLLATQVETVIALPEELKVAPTEGMVEAVERLFGSGVTSFQ
jgi:DNA polymerase-3 subunit alpha